MALLVHWAPYVALALLGVLTGLVAWRVGKKHGANYKEALSNRREYHALKSAQESKVQSAQNQTVNASPIIVIGHDAQVGAGLQSELRHVGRRAFSSDNRGLVCPLCNRFGCWFDCREAVTGGPSESGVSSGMEYASSPVYSDERSRVVRASTGRRVAGECNDLDSEEVLSEPDDFDGGGF
jgi:hypothetical protein